ncbi:MAG: bacterio-opsin activator domain-containing protein [Halobacteriota archaeon]
MARPDTDGVDFELKERAMDEAPVGITISDPDRPDNPLIYANASFGRITGYPVAEVLGRNCRFLQGTDTDPATVAELRDGIDAAEPVTVELLNYRRDGEPFWNEVTVAPLMDEAGEVTNFVGFQVDVTTRKEAQLALAEERERLDRLLDRIEGLLSDVTELLMQAVDRSETERAIVDRIAATDAFAAVWFGEPDLAQNALRTSSSAGFDGETDDRSVDLDADSPVARAFEERSLVLSDVRDEPAFERADLVGELAAIPLVYGDATYGVLAVVGATEDALDDRELVVLESVARTIATAINAAQSRRGLTADDLAELEFSITDESFFPVAIATAWGCHLELLGSTSTGTGGLRLFIDAREAEQVDGESLPPTDDIESVTGIEVKGGMLLEVDLAVGSVIDRLAERGAAVRSLTATPGVAELEITVPTEVGGRVVLEVLEGRLDGVELLAYRERERRPTTRSAFVDAFESRLTERQATALRSAFYAGYYDEPRTTSGDELASAMGVSRPTFHQHLRAAERKLLEAVLG